jgi:hypothetical protein
MPLWLWQEVQKVLRHKCLILSGFRSTLADQVFHRGNPAGLN